MFAQISRHTAKRAAAYTATAAVAIGAAATAYTTKFNPMSSFMPQASASTATTTEHGGLRPDTFISLQLADIQYTSPDSRLYFFNLPSPDARINLPVSSYILARAKVNGQDVVRPYTPMGDLEGEMALLVKTYPDGKLSNVFAQLKPGDSMEFKGPLPKFEYKTNEYDRVTLVAGGSGITPMFQIIDRIFNDPDDTTFIHLLFGNKTPEDILLKEVFDDLSLSYPDRFKVTYVIDKPVDGWNGPTGFIDVNLLQAIAGEPNPKHKLFICGPPGMVEAIAGPKGPNYTQGEVGGELKKLGYTSNDVFKF